MHSRVKAWYKLNIFLIFELVKLLKIIKKQSSFVN